MRPLNAHHPKIRRDAALRRLRRTNGWIVAASATLTGMLSALAANASIGNAHRDATGARTSAHARAARKATARRTHVRALRPPQQSPQPAPVRPSESELAPESATPTTESAEVPSAPAESTAEPSVSTSAPEASSSSEGANEPEAPASEPAPVVSGGS